MFSNATTSYIHSEISWPLAKKYLVSNKLHNTSYLTDSYIMFTLKMESVSKTAIFGLKMIVKSGLEKIFLKFLHVGDYFPLLHKSAQNHKFSNKRNYFPAWRNCIFGYRFHFEGKRDVWFSQVRCVKGIGRVKIV